MKTVLIVEDDTKIATALALRVRAAGFTSITTFDPLIASLAATTHKPDLIIADIWLPFKPGFELVPLLKALGLSDTPFIFITASRRVGLWETAMSLGAAGYYEKPYDPNRLMNRVREVLSETRSFP